jgi:formylglycine-generating enzyme required for sulfatase activity
MGKRKGERKLRVHCTQHRILFEVLEARTLVCDADGHALAHNFPTGEWWEFCCNCQTFWPSDAEHCGEGRESCPACEQPIAARYLCHRCMVLSNAPKIPPKGRGFRVSALGRVEPRCPGCSGVASPIIDHQCEGARMPLTTARPICPFCDEIIWETGGLGDALGEWDFDEAPAPPADATAAPEPDGFEPEDEEVDEEDAPPPPPSEDVLELWPQFEGAGVAAETGGTSQDVLYEFGHSGERDFEGGLPEDEPSIIEVGEAEDAPAMHRLLEADPGVPVRERPSAPADEEPVTAYASVETVTPPDARPGGESPNSYPFLHGYTTQRRAARISPKGTLLLTGVGIVALIIVAVWWLRPSADDPTTPSTASASADVRADAAVKGEPSPPTAPEGMVHVPGGTFKMGSDGGDQYEKPAHEVTVAPFYIDKFEVTCEEYQRFVDAKKYPAPAGWRNGNYPEGSARLPVEVSWREANAYAKWAGKRLPTEKEWEFAARGTDGRLYPWGNEWKAEAVNAKGTGPGRLTEVGLRPAGASPFGAFDMAGNAWEWTADSIHSYEGGKITEDSWPTSKRESQKVIRGGGYLSNLQQATSTYRSGWPEHGTDYVGTGFRCAKDVEPPAVRK